ncbi:MAG: hypothetical protein OIN66_00725 [Candidatus Methanoperedens sp.]|nr:hypothetical protein [Candidatus Methanoperedens sp.]
MRKEKPFEEFGPKKNPNPGHEDVQGMLLEPGGYTVIDQEMN